MSRPLATPAYRTPARGETQHTTFTTGESPPGCVRVHVEEWVAPAAVSA